MLRTTRNPQFLKNIFAKPVENFVGQCPVYGHKYYEIPVQEYGLGKTIKQPKRRVDFAVKFGNKFHQHLSAFSESEKVMKSVEIIENREYSVQWRAWLELKRRDPPQDNEIKMSNYALHQTALKGTMLEEQYDKEYQERINKPKPKSTVFVEQSKYSSVGTSKNQKSDGIKRDGMDQAEVDEWDPSKM